MTDQQKIEAAKRELAQRISESSISQATYMALMNPTKHDKLLVIMETYHGMLVSAYEILDK